MSYVTTCNCIISSNLPLIYIFNVNHCCFRLFYLEYYQHYSGVQFFNFWIMLTSKKTVTLNMLNCRLLINMLILNKDHVYRAIDHRYISYYFEFQTLISQSIEYFFNIHSLLRCFWTKMTIFEIMCLIENLSF